jgi:glutathione gamma-glutamylcysteinyltransferase
VKAQTFYRRKLPQPPATPFSSPEGRRLFAEALQGGTLECFFPLIEQFQTQNHPAFCGLGSLAMVLNALAIDPGKTWNGPWRWFSEDMLDCCQPLERSQRLRDNIAMRELRLIISNSII